MAHRIGAATIAECSMKRGTPDHPKTAALAAALGADIAKTCGTLELLWHFTAKFSPQGDVGKWSDEAIAKAVGWGANDGTPADLIRSLISGQWLDECSERRLLVHDWEEHTDDSTKKGLARKNLKVFKPVRKMSRHVRTKSAVVQTCPEKICLPEPSLALPSQSLTTSSSSPAKADGEQTVVQVFQCSGTGPKEYPLTETKLAEYEQAYPAVDVRSQIRQMAQWLRDNPANRKTYTGMPAFMNRWLSRAQNNGGGLDRKHCATNGKPSFDPIEKLKQLDSQR